MTIIIWAAGSAVIEKSNYNTDKTSRIMADFINMMKIKDRIDYDEMYLLLDSDTREYFTELVKIVMKGKLKIIRK
ncbi:hypothetical protein LCGC14_0224320 [marine sediment metagenome]|uniref:Uncharacterized protein n=1 Tax=marine sediment metagenome TaxID=412755 RepID=A0A0F9UGS1_9ZZZZ